MVNKDAVIYEIHVRAFQDSDGDGIGDFKGLTSRLDYLEDLGVTALWLLPFYPSPLKDDGYDIARYSEIHPNYGTLDDFKEFMSEAHKRGLKVITTELVLNHTSDQHEWFQEIAPRSKWASRFAITTCGTTRRRRSTKTRASFSRISKPRIGHGIPVAQSYYWHRFFSHQPDLNWDNPVVTKAMYEVVDFWHRARRRRPAASTPLPYLFEREGTSCENLPETHGALKALRAHIDSQVRRSHACSPKPISGPKTPSPTSATRATNAKCASIFR